MIKKSPKGFYQFPIFTRFPEIVQAVTTKKIGNLKFKKNFKINHNFQKILKMFYPVFKFTLFEQVHGANIEIVDKQVIGRILTGFDGGVTREKDLILGVFVADCFPILIYDSEKHIIGAAHAGWKGICAGIIKNLISKMCQLGSKVENLNVGIGPGICRNCYEIGKNLVPKFKFVQIRNGRIFLDLEAEIIGELIEQGIKKKNIERAGICVFENKFFFSFRREGKNLKGEQVALIGMR